MSKEYFKFAVEILPQPPSPNGLREEDEGLLLIEF